MFYLQRFATTSARLHQVLMNRVRRSARVHGTDLAEGERWVKAVVAHCVRLGLVDDQAYARGRAEGLRTAGLSRRGAVQRLIAKGVDPRQATAAVAGVDADAVSDDPELAAATAWARRHRLGPFGRPETRAERRRRDLGSLARAGFSYAVAAAVIDGEVEDGDPTAPPHR